MPCEKCNTILILDDGNELCPKCDFVRFLPQMESELVSDFRIETLNRLFSGYLTQVKKSKLIAHLLNEREEIACKFFFGESHNINPYQLLGISIMIQRVIRDGNSNGVEDLGSVQELVSLFERFLKICEENILISEGVAFYTYKRLIPYSELSREEALSNYKIVYREEWKSIFESYRDELFMSEADAKDYMEKYREEYEKLAKNKKTIRYSPETFITGGFPAINSLYSIFLKNVLFAQMFDLSSLKDYFTLEQLASIFRPFDRLTEDSRLMVATTENELDTLLEKLKLDKNLVKKKLLVDDNNTKTFPFLVKVSDGKDERILVTPKFFRILFILLHALFYKKLFDAERERRSKIIETVGAAEEFKKIGFDYKPNITDKKKSTLEIDGVAFNDSKCYVCEVKFRTIKPFFEQLQVHRQIIRDLKGIVDGKKYTEDIPKDAPQLSKKIDYVIVNREQLGIPKEVTDFSGLVITNFRPILKHYKGVKFIGFKEIQNL